MIQITFNSLEDEPDFPIRDIGGNQRFTSHWFEKYKWLEYSVHLDTIF